MDSVDLISSIGILNPSDHTMSLTPLEKILITVLCALVYYVVKENKKQQKQNEAQLKRIQVLEDKMEALVKAEVEKRYKSILEENKRIKKENERLKEEMAGMKDNMEALVKAEVEKRYKRILDENEQFKKENEQFKKEIEQFKEEMTGIVQGVRNDLISDFHDIIKPLFVYIQEMSDRQQDFGETLIRLSDAHRETENLVTIVEVNKKVEEVVLSKLESRHPDNLVKLGTTRLYKVDGDAFKNLSERPTPKKGEIDSSSVLALKKASKKFANQDTSCKENPTRYRNNKCHGAVGESLDTATAELL